MSGSPSKKQSPGKREIDSNDADQIVSNKRVRKDVTHKSKEELMKELKYVNLDIYKPITDKRTYWYFQLNNKLRVLVVSDSDCQMAKVHLKVRCGNINDPVHIPDKKNVQVSKAANIKPQVHLPGLAHYLEHMIYLTKSADHPRTNSLHLYLEKHGGHFDALTKEDITNYSFTVLSDYLSDSMGRFSDAIVNPITEEKLIRQEVNAIDTEFQHVFKYSEESNIWYALSKDYTKRPIYGGFGCGNKESLFTKPIKDNVDVIGEMKKLYYERYMSSNMCLVVIGKETPQELAEIVVKSKFGAMPMKDPPSDVLQQPVIAKTKREAFIDTHFRTDYKLQIQWNVRYSRNYPVKYINTLMKHKGPKGLLAKLKKRGWATDSHADFDDISTDSTIYYVDITLTKNGVKYYVYVVRIIYNYINFLQQIQSYAKLYTYCKDMEKKELVDNHNRTDYAELLCSRLRDVWIHKFPVESIFKKDSLRYDKANIADFLGQLNPDNCRIIVSGFDLIPLVTKADPKDFIHDDLHPMSYLIRKINDDAITEWENDGNVSTIELPDVSSYYPSEECNKNALTERSSLVPEVVHKENLFRVWYTQDNPKLPEFVSFRLHVAQEPAIMKDKTMDNQMFHAWWEDLLRPLIYIAECGGLKCIVENKEAYFTVHVEGYHQHLTKCVKTIMKKMLEVPNLTRVQFFNLRAMDYHWGNEVRWYNRFIEWIKKMLSSVTKLEFLVCGHITKSDAIELCKEVATSFGNQWETSPSIEHTNENDDANDHYNDDNNGYDNEDYYNNYNYEYDNEDEYYNDNNNEYDNAHDNDNSPGPTNEPYQPSSRYYREYKKFNPEIGDKRKVVVEFDCTNALEEFGYAIVEIFSKICNVECFTYLRTERMLAYVVEMYPENSKLVILVEANGPHEQVQKDIEHFLINDVKNIMDRLTPETLNEYTKSAGKTFEVKPINQSEAHTKNWTRLFTSALADFDDNHFKTHLENDEIYIKNLDELTPDKLKDFYYNYIHPDGKCLKYSIALDYPENNEDKSEYKKAADKYKLIKVP